jgi:hypothetical protein
VKEWGGKGGDKGVSMSEEVMQTLGEVREKCEVTSRKRSGEGTKVPATR